MTKARAEGPLWIVDGTLGGGGHLARLMEALAPNPRVKFLAVDQDEEAIARARVRFAEALSAERLTLQHARFSEIEETLRGRPVAGVLVDLGFSSDQIEAADRGLSFQQAGPIDMRLDRSRGASALEVIRQTPEKDLADIIFEYSEERFSRQIAANLKRWLLEKKLNTTLDLAECVSRAIPAQHRRAGGIHPATRTFQALRIAVNDELSELRTFLDRVILNVLPGGHVAVLTFHSLEDRMVKEFFRSSADFRPLSKKPIAPSDEETARNPRARSAKLRLAERVLPGSDG